MRSGVNSSGVNGIVTVPHDQPTPNIMEFREDRLSPGSKPKMIGDLADDMIKNRILANDLPIVFLFPVPYTYYFTGW